MRIEKRTSIAAPRERVWEIVADPARYPEFFADVSKWDLVGDQKTGLGARYQARLKVGSAPVGGLIEIVEWAPPGDLAWNSVTGVAMRVRWRLREREAGRTEVTIRLAYQAPGTVFGMLADLVSAPMMRRLVDRTLANLTDLAEREAETDRQADRR